MVFPGVVFVVLVSPCRPAAPPALTPVQSTRMKERDRLFALAQQHLRAGRDTELIAEATQALVIERRVFGEPTTGGLVWLARLASAQARQGAFEAAVKARIELLAVQMRRHGPQDWRVANARRELEDDRGGMQRTPEQARKLAEAARRSADAVRLAEKKTSAALESARRALRLYQEVLGKKHLRVADSLKQVASLYRRLGDDEQALLLYRRMLATLKEVLGDGHPGYAAKTGGSTSRPCPCASRRWRFSRRPSETTTRRSPEASPRWSSFTWTWRNTNSPCRSFTGT
jgi:tetratricopeptide (TPR) repeat protein